MSPILCPCCCVVVLMSTKWITTARPRLLVLRERGFIPSLKSYSKMELICSRWCVMISGAQAAIPVYAHAHAHTYTRCFLEHQTSQFALPPGNQLYISYHTGCRWANCRTLGILYGAHRSGRLAPAARYVGVVAACFILK
jgi:hypothetical protein